ncbi:hypothetical protein LNQ03_18815 [Klebsiella pneumoniae subsp. pneumoniae]|nr:hypothetical protein [Klebsiella pneumoniae subsp. pneumoniae]
MQWLETFYQMAARRGAQQQVTLPPFAEFWQANQLIEMPEEPENARFARFAAFRADPQANPLKTASGKIGDPLADHRRFWLRRLSAASDVAGARRVAWQRRGGAAAAAVGPSGPPSAQSTEPQPRCASAMPSPGANR